jgi:hypothetical protein
MTGRGWDRNKFKKDFACQKDNDVFKQDVHWKYWEVLESQSVCIHMCIYIHIYAHSYVESMEFY